MSIMDELTPRELELWDARSGVEAWELAHAILEPWVKSTERIGSDELTQVMKGALDEVNAQIDAHRDEVARLRSGR
jgi:hypothetical protein